MRTFCQISFLISKDRASKNVLCNNGAIIKSCSFIQRRLGNRCLDKLKISGTILASLITITFGVRQLSKLNSIFFYGDKW